MKNKTHPGWRCLLSSVAFGFFTVASGAPLELYGRLPSIEDVRLSSDGRLIASITTLGDSRFVSVRAVDGGRVVGSIKVGDSKVRELFWADEENLLIVVSTTADWPVRWLGGTNEWRQMLLFNASAKRTATIPDQQLLGPGAMNVVVGEVAVRRIDGHAVLFFRGIYLDPIRPKPMLVRVDLDTLRTQKLRGDLNWNDSYLLDGAGGIAARVQYNLKKHVWSIRVGRDPDGDPVASGTEEVDVPWLMGFGADGSSALIGFVQSGQVSWRSLSLADGKLGPVPDEWRKFTSLMFDGNSRLVGALRVEDDARYVFFDPEKQRHWDAIVRAFGNGHVQYVSASDDFSRIAVRVEGSDLGFGYELIDVGQHKASPLGEVYAGLGAPLETRRLTYKAADGLDIPAYLTLPRGRAPKGLPLVVLPHGGPQARDTSDFDWITQALAAQGYAVLRPNFRGSSLSEKMIVAGYGEWGRRMQTDVSDGVRYLVKEGIADPGRVCIVGASYGGYAALAGVTLEHGVYRCAVSIAGISDLRRFVRRIDEKVLHDNENLELRYWDRAIGAKGPDDPLLSDISPIAHVDNVDAPILLVHGLDDLVVPIEQSDRMYDALKDAKKDVSIVRMKGEDHRLSRSGTRVQALQAVVAFLRAHNPRIDRQTLPRFGLHCEFGYTFRFLR